MNEDSKRYILFMYDNTCDDHSGYIFKSRSDLDAKADDLVNRGVCHQFMVGEFEMVDQSELKITELETFGFILKKKQYKQLSLF